METEILETEEIPDRCLCELCNQICDYELHIKNLNNELEREIYLCKRCYLSILSYYWGNTENNYKEN